MRCASRAGKPNLVKTFAPFIVAFYKRTTCSYLSLTTAPGETIFQQCFHDLRQSPVYGRAGNLRTSTQYTHTHARTHARMHTIRVHIQIHPHSTRALQPSCKTPLFKACNAPVTSMKCTFTLWTSLSTNQSLLSLL
jgi:RNase P subunit RPR2